jgi:hypothetical protein
MAQGGRGRGFVPMESRDCFLIVEAVVTLPRIAHIPLTPTLVAAVVVEVAVAHSPILVGLARPIDCTLVNQQFQELSSS